MQRSWSEETLEMPDSTSWLRDQAELEDVDDGPADSTTGDGEAAAEEYPGVRRLVHQARELLEAVDEVGVRIDVQGINLENYLHRLLNIDEIIRLRGMSNDLRQYLEGGALDRVSNELYRIQEYLRRGLLPELAAARRPDQSHWWLRQTEDQEPADGN